MKIRKDILMVVTGHGELPNHHKTGIWFEEFALPYKLFKERGCSVTVASISGGAAPVDPSSLPENPDAATRLAALELQHTRALNDINVSDFDAVFFPGGHGTMFDFPDSQLIGKIVASFLQNDCVVSAVCHGSAALVAARFQDGTPVVKGRRVTSFTNEEERAAELEQLMPFLLQSKLSDLGAKFVSSPNWQDHIVIDGKLITGQNPQSSASVANAVLHAIAAV